MNISFEVEVEFEGSILSRGHPGTGPSYASGGDPPTPPELEIEGITSIGIIFGGYDAVAKKSTWKTVSITEDVDLKNPEVQKLLANIVRLKQEELETEIWNAGAQADE